MILPSKHISPEQTLLSVGAVILSELERPRTISAIWQILKTNDIVGNYERFILALNMLYIIRGITMKDGLIRRAHS